MAKATVKTKAKAKKKPVKAGSSNMEHGGVPTSKIVKIRAKLLSELKIK